MFYVGSLVETFKDKAMICSELYIFIFSAIQSRRHGFIIMLAISVHIGTFNVLMIIMN